MEKATKEEKKPKSWKMVQIDDTVSMAEKYRNLAKKDIVEKIILNDNVINLAIIKYKRDPMQIGYIYYYKFILNGIEYLDEIVINSYIVDKYEIAEKLIIDIFSKSIAKNILQKNKEIFYSLLGLV